MKQAQISGGREYCRKIGGVMGNQDLAASIRRTRTPCQGGHLRIAHRALAVAKPTSGSA